MEDKSNHSQKSDQDIPAIKDRSTPNDNTSNTRNPSPVLSSVHDTEFQGATNMQEKMNDKKTWLSTFSSGVSLMRFSVLGEVEEERGRAQEIMLNAGKDERMEAGLVDKSMHSDISGKV